MTPELHDMLVETHTIVKRIDEAKLPERVGKLESACSAVKIVAASLMALACLVVAIAGIIIK